MSCVICFNTVSAIILFYCSLKKPASTLYLTFPSLSDHLVGKTWGTIDHWAIRLESLVKQKRSDRWTDHNASVSVCSNNAASPWRALRASHMRTNFLTSTSHLLLLEFQNTSCKSLQVLLWIQNPLQRVKALMRLSPWIDDSRKCDTVALVTLEWQGPAWKILTVFAPVCLVLSCSPTLSLILLPQNCIRHKDVSLGSVWEEAKQVTNGSREWEAGAWRDVGFSTQASFKGAANGF